MSREKPIIIQADGSLLLEVNSDDFEDIRQYLLNFAELIKSPEHIHTYRITNVSLWNAATFKFTPEDIIEFLTKYSAYDVPKNIAYQIKDTIGKYGRIKIIKENNKYYLQSDDEDIIREVRAYKSIENYLLYEDGNDVLGDNDDNDNDMSCNRIQIDGLYRGHIKLALIHYGYPVEDLGGYKNGTPLPFKFREKTLTGGVDFDLRYYQKSAVEVFHANGAVYGGAGVVTLPCGSGKTVVGIGVMGKVQMHTLIITTGVTACKQWRDEIVDKTDIPADMVGLYNGENKTIKPVTIATYKILTYRKNKKSEFTHLSLFFEQNWGLIVYDEVHLLPAPIIRVTSEIQSMRRLGLTATLVREDGLESDVFCLIGPKKFDMPWRELESKNFIAKAYCYDIRVMLDRSQKEDYVMATDRPKFRIASENVAKVDVVKNLLKILEGKNILIIGQYISQLESLQKILNVPIITGKTSQDERDKIYGDFKTGKIKTLIVSKVANFAVDLPDANALIQISGTFGSRQEEAQRLGRVLRPKSGENISFFFSVITMDTKEEDFAHNRQVFLTEQGYHYEILDDESLDDINLCR